MTIPTEQADLVAWLATSKSDARLDLRVPQDLVDELERFAKRNGYKLSLAVKILLTSALVTRKKRGDY